ncbi:hypothetical protein A6A28_25730 [Streptomyces sp. CB03578]|uniref:hypothetical protein n=1 Tax=Streptomyces sp. CB03578 TaxID=1718987 RepID=UPI00093E6A63|nr:hypothetical protein [Streptomyces sp. CB03578]OKI41959.1 hypothetical protein A6A28_25730 [Streptomyces sp. CB03578]
MFDRLVDVLTQAKTLRLVIDFFTVVVRIIPALLVVIALVPSFASFAFLSPSPRRSLLEIVDRLRKWTLAQN